MKIQKSLITRIDTYIKELKKGQDLSDYEFKIRKSNSTNSIYIQVYSYIDSKQIRSSYRLSDHFNSKVKTKIITKHTRFDFIKRKIEKMIRNNRNIRVHYLMNSL